MKQDLFEEYLKSRFANDYQGTDDDMPDAFDTWISELSNEDLIAHAEGFGRSLIIKIGFEARKYTDPKPEYDGITWDSIISKINF